jgi:predicted oxidoreductase
MHFSEIIAGTMTWGKWGKALSTDQMTERIESAVSMGVSSFDHADIYGDYTTETEFGAAFEQSNIERSSVQLITKCGIQMTRGRDHQVKHYQYDYDYIMYSVQRSLEQLRTSYIDALLLHRPSPLMVPEEIGRAIAALLESGQIKSFGLSNFLPHQVDAIARFTPVQCNQVQFSITHTDVMYDGTLDQALAQSIVPMAWKPLGGLFDTQDERAARIREVADPLCKKYGLSLAGLGIAFIKKHPSGVLPVVGTTEPERLADLLKASKVDLELQDWFVLLEASQGRRVP